MKARQSGLTDLFVIEPDLSVIERGPDLSLSPPVDAVHKTGTHDVAESKTLLLSLPTEEGSADFDGLGWTQ